MVDEAINTTGKEKVIVIQPFGRGVMNTDGYIFDPTSRSFNVSDISIINNLKKDYCVIVMSEFKFDRRLVISKYIIVPNIEDIRFWASIIECADHFLRM